MSETDETLMQLPRMATPQTTPAETPPRAPDTATDTDSKAHPEPEPKGIDNDLEKDVDAPTGDDSMKSSKKSTNNKFDCNNPTLDPYIGKLERYELFCTNQSYYLVGCNKQNSQYRVIKMDRTLIERPVAAEHDNKGAQQQQQQPTQVNMSTSNTSNASDSAAQPGATSSSSTTTAMNQTVLNDTAHNAKPTLRNLSEFLTEDPNVYSQTEIQDMLDMIHDGNRLRKEDHRAVPVESGGGGLKPIAKAYGIVGFIKFLDCYSYIFCRCCK